MPLSRTSPSTGPTSPEVRGFYHKDTGSIQYLAVDPATRKGAFIDVVMDFDPRAARVSSAAADHILNFAKTEDITIEWVLDTHPHADHLMASSYLKEKTGAPNAIGEKTREIASLWREFYNLPDAFDVDAAFDHLFAQGDTFKIGNLDVRVMLSPGHTLGSISFVVGDDAAFVHDTFMQPDVGTSRADFPGGTATDLYQSLQDILTLPDNTRLFIGHDYGTTTRPAPKWESTVLEQRRHNAHLGGGTSKDDFVTLREARDKTLALPDRMLHVLQMNLIAGAHPEPEDDGARYLKVPLDKF
jgi:glyoxylase-like metal-dependent hydrolase (beta-lactamase superfamily II)